jgi:hypothetical protein
MTMGDYRGARVIRVFGDQLDRLENYTSHRTESS